MFGRMRHENFIPSSRGQQGYVYQSGSHPGYCIRYSLHEKKGAVRQWRCFHCSSLKQLDRKLKTGLPPAHCVKDCNGEWLSNPDGGSHVCGWPTYTHMTSQVYTNELNIKRGDPLWPSGIVSLDPPTIKQEIKSVKKEDQFEEQSLAEQEEISCDATTSEDPLYSLLIPFKIYYKDPANCLLCNRLRSRRDLAFFTANQTIRGKWIKMLGGEPFREHLDRHPLRRQVLCRSHFPQTQLSGLGRVRRDSLPIVPEGSDNDGFLPLPLRLEHDYPFYMTGGPKTFFGRLKKHRDKELSKAKAMSAKLQADLVNGSKLRVARCPDYSEPEPEPEKFVSAECGQLLLLLNKCPKCSSKCHVSYLTKNRDLYVDRCCPLGHFIELWTTELESDTVVSDVSSASCIRACISEGH